MRKHGWQLPYHPLQVLLGGLILAFIFVGWGKAWTFMRFLGVSLILKVVAVAVFLALGFAFYVFFAPFVGKKVVRYVVMGVYTPLIISVFSLYIWCAAADPADSGVFKSKKYLHVSDNEKSVRPKDSKLGGESTSSLYDANAAASAKSLDGDSVGRQQEAKESTINAKRNDEISEQSPCMSYVFAPCALISKCCCPGDESSENHASEDGMFYCSLCEVEVFKYSKHCRVCDKCVDRFDHHCRWLNNCIGRKNYRQFFTLMVFSLLLLILQWLTGIFVLICCFIEKKRFLVDISAKLGSSFSLVPYAVVVAVCTVLAMVATLPLAQLFFFHVLLIKKGISTYDYIIALREQEQEQQGLGTHQSAQMSPASSITGLSSASSFSTFHRGAWCTPPRLFLEDQYDVVPPETASVSSLGKKTAVADYPLKKKNPAAVQISPWTLARLNAEDVSRAAAEARKKSKILQPVMKKAPSFETREKDRSFSSSSRRSVPRLDNNRRRPSKWVRLPADMGMETHANLPLKNVERGVVPETSTSLAPLQLEARSAFQTSRAMSSSAEIMGSSPESSLDSPDMHPLQVSSTGLEEARGLAGMSTVAGLAVQRGFPLSRSTSDGYEASGGEDSDRVPSRNFQRPAIGNWTSLLGFEQDERVVARLRGPSSAAAAARVEPRKP